MPIRALTTIEDFAELKKVKRILDVLTLAKLANLDLNNPMN